MTKDDKTKKPPSYLRAVPDPLPEGEKKVEEIDDLDYFWDLDLMDVDKSALVSFASTEVVEQKKETPEDKITGDPSTDIAVLAERAIRGEVTMGDALTAYIEAMTSDPASLSDAYQALGLVLKRQRDGMKAVQLAEATVRQGTLISIRTLLDMNRVKLQAIIERPDTEGVVEDVTRLAVHRELVREMKVHHDFIRDTLQMIETSSDSGTKKVRDVIEQLMEPSQGKDAWDEILRTMPPDKQRDVRASINFIIFNQPNINLDDLDKALDAAVDAEIVPDGDDNES